MKASDLLSGPPTPLRPLATSWRPAATGKGDSAHVGSGDAALTAPPGLVNNASSSCCCSTPLGATPTALSVPPLPPTHLSDLGDDLLREILSKTGVLDRAVTARMVSRAWRAALAPPPGADAAVTGRGLCKDVDVTTEPRLLGRLDTDLLLRLLWLSSWGGNPRAADVPSWGSTFPWLRSLRLSGARWRPTAAHRVPSLRRVLGACPGVTSIDATALRVLVPAPAGVCGGGGGGEAAAAGEGEGDDLFFDAAEAQLLAAAALHHASVEELELDVSVRLSLDDAAEPPIVPEGAEEDEEAEGEPPRRGVWEDDEASPMETAGAAAGERPFFRPSPPSPLDSLRLLPTSSVASDPSAARTAAVDVAEVILAARTPLRVRRLSLSTPPTALLASASSSGASSAAPAAAPALPLLAGGDRAALAPRCLRLGRAAALGGELRTLTLDRLTPEESAAAVAGALSGDGRGKLERIEFRGVGGGAPSCWSEGVAAAVAGALSSGTGSRPSLRELVFEGDAGGRDAEARRGVEASARRAAGGERLSVRFVEEGAARRASGAAYAARAAASASAANAAAHAAAAANAAAAAANAAAFPRPPQVLLAAVPV